MEDFTCSMCYRFTATSVSAVLRHIGTVHAHQSNFEVVCGVNGCPRTYQNYHSFRKHIHRKHIDLQFSEASNVDVDDELDHDGSAVANCPIVVNGSQLPVWNQRSAALFILKNKEVRQISQLHLSDLLSDVSMVVQQSVNSLTSQIKSV